MVSKKCSKCRKIKPLSEFWNARRYSDGKYPSCKVCQKKTTSKWLIKNKEKYRAYSMARQTQPGRIYERLLSRKRHKVKFSRKEFIVWFNSQKKKCCYCGLSVEKLPLQKDKMLKRFCRTLSIDRVDNEKDYELSNIVLACLRCNWIKSDFFNFKEMKEIGKRYVKPKWRD